MGKREDIDGVALPWEKKGRPSYTLVGEVLPLEMVKSAKREELFEMCRRSVRTETSIADCVKVTDKPPIPVRCVISNKRGKLNNNVRARLVAKHLVAKYGGKGLHELFAAMPPLEMAKSF